MGVKRVRAGEKERESMPGWAGRHALAGSSRHRDHNGSSVSYLNYGERSCQAFSHTIDEQYLVVNICYSVDLTYTSTELL